MSWKVWFCKQALLRFREGPLTALGKVTGDDDDCDHGKYGEHGDGGNDGDDGGGW